MIAPSLCNGALRTIKHTAVRCQAYEYSIDSTEQSETLFNALTAAGFVWEAMPKDRLHPDFVSPKIEIYEIRMTTSQ